MVRSFAAIFAALACLVPAPASAEPASDWSPAHGGAMRLLPGPAGKESRGAGLEIKLEPGWKTYWRDPGDSGVPPVFDWSGSSNLRDITVAWPAPIRMEDEAGMSIGYKHDVVFPLSVRAIDPAKPVELQLSLDYAVCEKICVPAKGEARLRLDPDGSPEPGFAETIAAHQARVPVAQAIGATGPLAVTDVRLDAKAKPPAVLIGIRAEGDVGLFVEGASDWYLPAPVAVPHPSGFSGSKAFSVTLDDLPKAAKIAGTTLRITVVGSDGAIETFYTLP